MAEIKEAGKKGGDKKKHYIIFWVMLLVLLTGGSIGGWFFLKQKPVFQKIKDFSQQASIPGLNQQSQIGPMVNIDEFIVNVISGDVAHYVKTSITVELTNKEVKTEVEQRMPQIRDAILLLISNKTYEELQDLQGKKQLKAELMSRINTFLQTGKLTSIYFTNFVVQ